MNKLFFPKWLIAEGLRLGTLVKRDGQIWMGRRKVFEKEPVSQESAA